MEMRSGWIPNTLQPWSQQDVLSAQLRSTRDEPKGFWLEQLVGGVAIFFFFKVTKNVRSTNIREKTKNLELVSLSWTLI